MRSDIISGPPISPKFGVALEQLCKEKRYHPCNNERDSSDDNHACPSADGEDPFVQGKQRYLGEPESQRVHQEKSILDLVMPQTLAETRMILRLRAPDLSCQRLLLSRPWVALVTRRCPERPPNSTMPSAIGCEDANCQCQKLPEWRKVSRRDGPPGCQDGALEERRTVAGTRHQSSALKGCF